MSAMTNCCFSRDSKMRASTGMIVTGLTIISFISSLSGNPVHAGPVTYGGMYVHGTGVSPMTDSEGNLIANPEYNSRQTFYESNTGLSKSDSLTSYTMTYEGIKGVNAATSIVSRNGNLGVYAATSGPAPSVARSGVSWSDSVQLVPPSVGGHRLSDSLIFNFRIEGQLETRAPEFGYGGSQITATLFDQEYFNSLKTNVDDPGDKTLVIRDDVGSRLRLTDGYANFQYSLDVLSQSGLGSASGDFINTMTLKSITFADGTTPESYGYSLIFGSGMVSPNVSAVPEPSTLALVGLGGVGVAISAYRRRRIAA